MDELTEQRQRVVLEIACKEDDPSVWEEAFSTCEMKDFLSDPNNFNEIASFLKKYENPPALIRKIKDMEQEGEEILSRHLL